METPLSIERVSTRFNRALREAYALVRELLGYRAKRHFSVHAHYDDHNLVRKFQFASIGLASRCLNALRTFGDPVLGH